eukprot:SAG31_NODE_30880_length_375_cov_0.565217_1_plen_80_part_01
MFKSRLRDLGYGITKHDCDGDRQDTAEIFGMTRSQDQDDLDYVESPFDASIHAPTKGPGSIYEPLLQDQPPSRVKIQEHH